MKKLLTISFLALGLPLWRQQIRFQYRVLRVGVPASVGRPQALAMLPLVQ